jgi:uncharacterized membrane protein (UPF0127 family)
MSTWTNDVLPQTLYAKGYAYIYPWKPRNYKAWLQVQIPLEQSLKQQGLMYLKSLPDNFGMIFMRETPNYMAMWMKDTYVPLDMIFVHNNRIVHIHKNAKPLDLNFIHSEAIVDYCLEVKAGFVDKYQIEKGDQIALRIA